MGREGYDSLGGGGGKEAIVPFVPAESRMEWELNFLGVARLGVDNWRLSSPFLVHIFPRLLARTSF